MAEVVDEHTGGAPNLLRTKELGGWQGCLQKTQGVQPTSLITKKLAESLGWWKNTLVVQATLIMTMELCKRRPKLRFCGTKGVQVCIC